VKLLIQLNTRTEVEKVKYLFESSGVPIEVANENTAAGFGSLAALHQYAVWVVFDEQFEDAKALLNDSNHIVQHPIDMQHYIDTMNKNEAQVRSKLQSKMIVIGVLCILFVVALVAVIANISG